MAGYVVDTQAIVKFLAGKKVINESIHQIMEMADEGENIIIIPSVVISRSVICTRRAESLSP